jgi:hypothetical protein
MRLQLLPQEVSKMATTSDFATFSGTLGKTIERDYRYPEDYVAIACKMFSSDNAPTDKEHTFLIKHLAEARKNPEIIRLLNRNNEHHPAEVYFNRLENLARKRASEKMEVAVRKPIVPKFVFRTALQVYPCGHEVPSKGPYQTYGSDKIQCPIDGKEWDIKVILGKQAKGSVNLTSPSDNSLADKTLLARQPKGE